MVLANPTYMYIVYDRVYAVCIPSIVYRVYTVCMSCVCRVWESPCQKYRTYTVRFWPNQRIPHSLQAQTTR